MSPSASKVFESTSAPKVHRLDAHASASSPFTISIPIKSGTMLARRFAMLVGLLDLFSGFGFIAVPHRMLAIMGIGLGGDEAASYLRFVGAFVFAVGATYLWASLRSQLLRPLLALSIPLRLAVGGFVAIACLNRWLDVRWSFVTFADLAIVGAQLWFLRTQFHHDGDASPSSDR
jgi:hypothetical protein